MHWTFEPIDLDRQKSYMERLAVCPQKTSDYSFVNLWAWAEEYGLRWAWEQGQVWIRQTNPQPQLWAPVGSWTGIDWRQVRRQFGGGPLWLVRVPEKMLGLWSDGRNGVHIEEARGQWDYLYPIEDLVALDGKRFHKKKNLFNQFVKKYDCEYVALDDGFIQQALSMQDDWCTWRDCESSEMLAAENRAIARVLGRWEHLVGIRGGGLRVGHKMVAYTVAEPLSENTLLVHFEKGNPEYKGVYQAINQMFLAHADKTFRIVNREQDLDDEGLRKAKLSYHPVAYERKYRVMLPS